MNNGVLYTLQSLKGFLYNMLTGLGQHLNRYIIRNKIILYQFAQEGVLRLGSSREPNFDFLKAYLHQHLKELYLFIQTHRNNKGLIAIPKIHRTPFRCLFRMLLVHPAHIRLWWHIIPLGIFCKILHHILPLCCIAFPYGEGGTRSVTDEASLQ